jgi:hypothetical protein
LRRSAPTADQFRSSTAPEVSTGVAAGFGGGVVADFTVVAVLSGFGGVPAVGAGLFPGFAREAFGGADVGFDVAVAVCVVVATLGEFVSSGAGAGASGFEVGVGSAAAVAAPSVVPVVVVGAECVSASCCRERTMKNVAAPRTATAPRSTKGSARVFGGAGEMPTAVCTDDGVKSSGRRAMDTAATGATCGGGATYGTAIVGAGGGDIATSALTAVVGS